LSYRNYCLNETFTIGGIRTRGSLYQMRCYRELRILILFSDIIHVNNRS